MNKREKLIEKKLKIYLNKIDRLKNEEVSKVKKKTV